MNLPTPWLCKQSLTKYIRNDYHVIDNILKRKFPEAMMTRPNVLMIGPYPQWDMEPLEENYDIHKLWAAVDKSAFIASHADKVRAIATRGELGANSELIGKLPKLEIISCYGVGIDAIDLVAAKSRGIRVTNTPDVLTEDVADIALGLLISVARKIPQADTYVRDGSWQKANMPLVTRFHGKRLGIIGMGRVGAAVARRAVGFAMKISYFDTRRRDDLSYTYEGSILTLAKNSDFLVATVAGGSSTTRLIDAKVFEALGAKGYFVNVARGSVVDEPALLDALMGNKIAGAGLDVFWNEPNIDAKFLILPNVVLQPHHASGTVETRKAMGQLVRDNLAAHFSGQKLLTQVV
jgi:lactate dehydrogenase-like 2-hydroxyacid dehydrogenase